MSAPANLAASVKARLQNIASDRGDNFNLLLTRYGIERLLFRLSRSPHADRFLLKGAMLFVVWDDKTHRPTQDLDLLGFGPSEKSDLLAVFREVAATPVADDGLVFDPASVTAEAIREDNAYGGIRVRLLCKLGPARIPIQVDIGVGDAVTPAPESVRFPALLDFPSPEVRAYPIYTVVAEKFEAMVKLGSANTRMKDFYDLWFLARRFEFEPRLLRTAIETTFARRETTLSSVPEVFTPAYADDPTKQVQWSAFLRRNGLNDASARFGEIIAHIRTFLAPALNRE